MSDIREFKIHLIGISDSDKQVLKRVLRLRHSPTSLRNYVLTDLAAPEDDKKPDEDEEEEATEEDAAAGLGALFG